MFTRKVVRAATLATLVAVALVAPVVRAQTGATGSSSGDTGTGTSSDTTTKGKMPPSPAAMRKMQPQQIFNMMDADHKGYVTKEEFMKFQEQLFNTWDKDKSGRLAAPVFTDEG